MPGLFLCAALALVYVSSISANDPFESFLKIGPCLATTNPPECSTSIVQAYRTKNRLAGTNEPTTAFYLFTPTRTEKAEPLHQCGGRLPEDTTFDPSALTVFLIHGWLDGVCRTAWMREMKEQFFQRQRVDNSTKYNVVLIDWSWGNFPDYKDAGVNLRVMAEQTAFVINNIMRQKQVSASRFHIVGHSFGAIAAGFIGRGVRGKLGRITALDPAYAPYADKPPNKRVTYRDATFVDVIHSNGGMCFADAVGDSRFLGHVDFYPNGGFVQLSCYPYIAISLLKGDILYALGSIDPRLCAHVHSLQYFKESINPHHVQYVGIAAATYEDFQSGKFRCGPHKYAVMGLDSQKYWTKNGRRQKYFLTTSLNCPYYDDSYLNKSVKFPFKTSESA